MSAVVAGGARGAYLAGMSAAVPFVIGTVPFGVVTGIATKAAGLTPLEAAAMTIIVFAGTAQIAALPLLVAGVPATIVILTAFIINLRFLIYGASVVPYFRHMPLRWKLLLGYFVTDTGFALFMRRVADDPAMPHRHWFFLGAGNMVAVIWVASAVLGIVAGAQVPKAWQLEFAATLGILALLVPFLRDRAEFVAAIVASTVALAATGLPMKLGLVCGALAGIAAGALAERALAQGRR
ncbi:MAG: AzlC family ABC transporter permease [Burkholderiales bacterium]|nr:AzlC family ABC transporter permease [Burkholderiales bacterium]